MWLKEKETGFTSQGPGRKLSSTEDYSRLPTEIHAKLGKPKRMRGIQTLATKGSCCYFQTWKVHGRKKAWPVWPESYRHVGGAVMQALLLHRNTDTTGEAPRRHGRGKEDRTLPAPAVYSAPRPAHWLKSTRSQLEKKRRKQRSQESVSRRDTE